MSFITKYGSFWGLIPVTSGRVFWVAPSATYTVEGRTYSASNDNDGLSPERAFSTLTYAVTKTTASVGDVIVLLPGAHSWAASAAVNVAGITITGIPSGKGNYMRQRTTITTSAADEVMNVTAANVELAYFTVIVVTAQAGIDYSNAADFLSIHDVAFDMYTAAESTSTVGLLSIATSSGASNLLLDNVYFESLGGTGNHLDVNDTVTSEVRNTTFRHRGSTALASAVISATGAVDILFENCRWLAGTTAIMTRSITWTANTADQSCLISKCIFPAGPVPLVASADNDIAVSAGDAQAMIIASGGSVAVNVINAA